MKRQRVSGPPPLSPVQSAVAARLAARTLASGTVMGPCLPSLHSAYVKKLDALFAIMDRPLADDRREALAKLLDENLAQGFAATPHARICIEYRPIDGEPPGVHCDIKLEGPSAEELYSAWLAWLGAGAAPESPDETLLSLLHEFALPARARALDVGPGVKHAQTLVALGLRVEAFEPISSRASELRRSSASRALALKVLEQDALDEATQLATARYDLIVVADVAPRLATAESQRAIEKLAPALTPGGKLLFNTFLIETGATISAAEREHAQRSFSTYLTEDDLSRLVESSGLKLQTKVATPMRGTELPKQRGSVTVSTAALKPTPPQPDQPSTGYTGWSAGARGARSGARALPLRLHWLCLTRG